MAKIKVLDREVGVVVENDEDYICITDIARYKDPERTDYLIQNWILEQGNMQDGGVLLKGFLGKEPTTAAFYERLNITVPAGNTGR